MYEDEIKYIDSYTDKKAMRDLEEEIKILVEDKRRAEEEKRQEENEFMGYKEYRRLLLNNYEKQIKRLKYGK